MTVFSTDGAIGTGSERPRFGTRSALFAALLLLAMMADPTDSGLGLTTTQQFLPAIIAIVGGMSYLAGGIRLVGGIVWQDYSLAIIILMTLVGGGATAQLTGNPTESFLPLALSALAYLPYRLLAGQPEQLDWFARKFSFWVVVVGVAMSFQLFWWQLFGPFLERRAGLMHIYHEEVFLLAVAAAVVSIRLRHRPKLRLALISMLIIGQLFTLKNTGFLTAILTILILRRIPAKWISGRPGRVKLVRMVTGVYLVLSLAGFLVMLPTIVDHLPSGSPGVRLYTYDFRLRQFLEAPILGQFFMGTPRLSVPQTNLYIPSHSDLLDLLAFGGVIGTMSFLLPIFGMVVNVRHLSHFEEERVAALVSVTLLLSVLIVWLFNPVWSQPKMGGVLWIGLAMQIGISSRKQAIEKGSRRRQSDV